MSTRHIDQFDYTCDRCKAKRVVDVVDDTIVVLPNDWIELEGSPWDNRRHLCYKCAVDFRETYSLDYDAIVKINKALKLHDELVKKGRENE